MAYKKMVVGTDGSATASAAVDLAARLAARLGAELLIVSAYEPPDGTASKAEKVLEEARRRAGTVGPEPSVEFGEGTPADVLIEKTEGWGASLLVVGDVGLGAARRFSLGGVPDQVSHYAPCDVVITRTSEDPTHAVDPYRKVLIGTDGSETAFDAVKRGFRLATSLGAEVTLVFVGPEDPGQYILQETARQLGDTAKISTVVMEGDPADTICVVARREGIDLIVVGNKGMSGARRVLLGSVPNKVSHTADSDVLIARTVEKSLLDLKPGDGGVVTIEGQKVAAYLDPSGQVFAVSARCTHMGCTVAWNHADQTWDCPCHGSRFDRHGEVVSGPANRPLPKVDV